ncbi:hypothetical protein [Arthrobacter sp. B1I2]|uniref:hypothetical protein n=1 Tax=Arthrobacter sp. B1I2 TaxID=3042263 RepID=UPI0027862C1F|nr:hypothetical protein [Arthrobacter sp. B1I2]MDQ0730442.1 hypothetical protein [Arthrobacter sp. B1I2]
MVDFEVELGSPAVLRQLQLLVKIRELAATNRHRSADTTGLYEQAEEFGLGWRAVGSDLDSLKDRGWINFDNSSGPVTDVVMSQQGVDTAEEFEAFRSNKRRRAQAVRSAVLQWLYDESLDGKSSPNISGFSSSKYGSFYGTTFTEGEIAQATRYLREEQLLQGKAAMGGGVIRPQITTYGMQRIEHEDKPATVLASERASVTYINNFNNDGPVNLATNSPGAQQSITLTTTQINGARMAASAFSQTLPILGIPENRQTEAKQVIAELEDETAAVTPQPGKLKSLLNKVIELAVLGTAEGAVGAVVSLAEKAIEGL